MTSECFQPTAAPCPYLAVLCGVLSCMLGCGAADANPEALFSPGQHQVGYQRTTMQYPRAGSGEPREIPLSVWYPASPDDESRPAVYTAALIFPIRSSVAWASAPPASGEAFPVVVYGHGGGAEAQHAYPYAERLASHGFIVIAPDHVGSTTAEALNGFASPVRWALDRPSDVSAALDWLADPSNALLAGRAETERVAFLGYSMGSYTGYALSGAEVDMATLRDSCDDEACALLEDPDFVAAYRELADPRIAVAVHQASGESQFLRRDALGALEQPVMLVSGAMDLTNPPDDTTEPIWNAGSGEYWLRLPGAGHLSFIPTCRDLDPDLVEVVVPNAREDGCGPANIAVEDALDVLAAYALGFFRASLLGEAEWDSVLAGPALRPGVEVVTR